MKNLALAVALLCVLGVQAAPDRSQRVINGQVSTNQPYNVYILYLNQNNAGFYGGGSIISTRHVLTAAQIILGFVRWDIGMGSNVFAQLSMVTSYQATSHPLFNSANKANDIGIITLPVTLTFTASIAPVRLPALNSQEINLLPLDNEQGTVVGYGYTSSISTTRSDYLMVSYQRVTVSNRCQQFYQITLPQHFCAENTIDYSNICNGDLGAGLVTDVRGTPTVTGIASLITQSCSNISPSGYTRVQYYKQWITSVTGIQ
nr:chymotrypsin-like [Aedes albopictus]